jgi:hypothetical protein
MEATEVQERRTVVVPPLLAANGRLEKVLRRFAPGILRALIKGTPIPADTADEVDQILLVAAKKLKAKLDARRSTYAAMMANSALYRRTKIMQAYGRVERKSSGRMAAAAGQSKTALSFFRSNGILEDAAEAYAHCREGDRFESPYHFTAMTSIAREKILPCVQTLEVLRAPGLLDCVLRHNGLLDIDGDFFLPVESTENLGRPPGELLYPVFRQNDMGVLEGRTAFNTLGKNGGKHFAFALLERVFGDAINVGSYVGSFKSPLLPGGFFPEVPVTLSNIWVNDREGKKIRALVDGSGKYHPNCEFLQAFIQERGVAYQGGMIAPVIQIRGLCLEEVTGNPEHRNMFLKGLLVPDETCVDAAGNPTVRVAWNQIKGTAKDWAKAQDEVDAEMVVKAHLGILKTWSRASTIKSCFELLQLVTVDNDTTAAVERLVQKAMDKLLKDGVDGLISEDSGGNTTLNNQITMVRVAKELGLDYSLLDIPVLRQMAEDKLKRRLYNIANGTGFEGNQVVMVMDNSLNKGECVIGGVNQKLPAVGDETVLWRFPAILPQSLMTLKVVDPLPHMTLSVANADGEVVDRIVVPFAVFMNPDDVTDLQGDDDGDIAAWTTDEDVKLLANRRIWQPTFRIEPAGEKMSIPFEDQEAFYGYLLKDPMGPVGQATILQARAYAINQARLVDLRYWARLDKIEYLKEDPEGMGKWHAAFRRVKSLYWSEQKSNPATWQDGDGFLGLAERVKYIVDAAKGWIPAWGTFIQESIDRAKRIVRWTNAPKVSNLRAWKKMADGHIYCHYDLDSNGKAFKFGSLKGNGISSENFLDQDKAVLKLIPGEAAETFDSLTLSQKCRLISSDEVLIYFQDKFKEAVGMSAFFGVLGWRRNNSAMGERLRKRIDPNAFGSLRYQANLSDIAYTKACQIWEKRREELGFNRPAKPCAGLPYRILRALHQKAEQSGATPPMVNYGEKRLPLFWVVDKIFRTIQGEGDSWKNPAEGSHLAAWRDQRVVWRLQNSRCIDFDAMGKWMEKTKVPLHPLARLDQNIYEAMSLSDSNGETREGEGHNSDSQESSSARKLAMDFAYEQFSAEMREEQAKDALAPWITWARESLFSCIAYRRGNNEAGIYVELQKVGDKPLGTPQSELNVKKDGGLNWLTKADSRALDALCFEGSTFLDIISTKTKESCLLTAEDADGYVSYFVSKHKLTPLRGKNEIKLCALVAELAFDTAYAYPTQEGEVPGIQVEHFRTKHKPLHECEECMAVLKKAAVARIRSANAPAFPSTGKLVSLTAALQKKLRDDKSLHFAMTQRRWELRAKDAYRNSIAGMVPCNRKRAFLKPEAVDEMYTEFFARLVEQGIYSSWISIMGFAEDLKDTYLDGPSAEESEDDQPSFGEWTEYVPD